MKILIGLWKYFAISKRFRVNYKEFAENYSRNCTVNHNNIRTPLSKMNLHWSKGETWLYFKVFFCQLKKNIFEIMYMKEKNKK